MRKKLPVNGARRYYRRFRVEAFAIIKNGRDEKQKTVLLRDLSSRGMGIISDIPLNLNDHLLVVVNTPCLNKTISQRAKIVWCSQIDDNLWRVGLDFGMADLVDL